jgi:hypothetical protein
MQIAGESASGDAFADAIRRSGAGAAPLFGCLASFTEAYSHYPVRTIHPVGSRRKKNLLAAALKLVEDFAGWEYRQVASTVQRHCDGR